MSDNEQKTKEKLQSTEEELQEMESKIESLKNVIESKDVQLKTQLRHKDSLEEQMET